MITPVLYQGIDLGYMLLLEIGCFLADSNIFRNLFLAIYLIIFLSWGYEWSYHRSKRKKRLNKWRRIGAVYEFEWWGK